MINFSQSRAQDGLSYLFIRSKHLLVVSLTQGLSSWDRTQSPISPLDQVHGLSSLAGRVASQVIWSVRIHGKPCMAGRDCMGTSSRYTTVPFSPIGEKI